MSKWALVDWKPIGLGLNPAPLADQHKSLSDSLPNGRSLCLGQIMVSSTGLGVPMSLLAGSFKCVLMFKQVIVLHIGWWSPITSYPQKNQGGLASDQPMFAKIHG